jgi:hypothetical protein
MRDHPRQSVVSFRAGRMGAWVCGAGVWISVSRMVVVLRTQLIGLICYVFAAWTWDCWKRVCGACSSPLRVLFCYKWHTFEGWRKEWWMKNVEDAEKGRAELMRFK